MIEGLLFALALCVVWFVDCCDKILAYFEAIVRYEEGEK